MHFRLSMNKTLRFSISTKKITDIAKQYQGISFISRKVNYQVRLEDRSREFVLGSYFMLTEYNLELSKGNFVMRQRRNKFFIPEATNILSSKRSTQFEKKYIRIG
uniref:Uncharacterized protein n=1 Tax=Parascaris univalens TaxID=6257 RepID=A0A915C4K0_PARUN